MKFSLLFVFLFPLQACHGAVEMSETLLPSAAASSLVGTAFSSQEFVKVDTVTRKILQT